MTSTLSASVTGLEIVDRARQKKDWTKAGVAWQVRADVSKSSLDRFWMQKPIKRQNFKAICTAVGVDWEQVIDELPEIESTNIARKSNLAKVNQPVILELEEFGQQIFDWFGALDFKFEGLPRQEGKYVEWVIQVPVRRSRFDRVLIRATIHEAGLSDLDSLRRGVAQLRVDEGWLVTNLWVSQSVRQALNKSDDENLTCLTFDELIDQDADFTPYLDWLEREISKREIDRYYVDLGCTKGEFDADTRTLRGTSKYSVAEGGIDRYIDRWLENPVTEHVSILGEFGTGKTWFALHYAGKCLQAYQAAKSKGMPRPRLPLVIPLRDYAKALDVENVFAGFFYTQHNIRLNSEVFDRLNQMGKLLLIFDGFDEMAERIDTQKMTDNFWELAKVVTTNAKVILTCRTEHFPTAQDGRENFGGERIPSTVNKIALAPKFETLELMKFDDEQIRAVLSRRTNSATVELVMANSQLLDLLQRAVMAEFVLEALPEIERGERIDLARVYLYAVRHKMERDITTGRTFTSLADKLYFLCELSWEMLSEDKMSLNYRDFPDRLRVLFKSEVKEQKHLDHWHYDMMGQTMLIRNDDGDYSPAHRSLLEFFVAYKLAAELGLLADDFLKMAQSQLERNIDRTLPLRLYTWAEYWEREIDEFGQRKPIAFLAGFKPELSDDLRHTFGKSPLTRAMLDLLLPALNLEVKYRESNHLLDLIKSTRAADVGYLGGNAATVLVKINSDALEYQNLTDTNLDYADLVNAGLRGTTLSGANLDNCQVTRVFGSITAISMSKDNRQFFTAHDDGTIRIWDLHSCQELKKLIGHHKNVNCIVLSVDGQFLYSGGADRKIKEWKLADGNCQHTFEGHQSSINCVALSVDGQFLYSGGQDRTIKEWKLEDKICQRNFNSVPRLIDGVKLIQLTSGVLAITLSSNGQYLYAGCDDGIIEEWKLADGKCQRNFVDGNYSISAITLSTDGQWLYSGGSSIKEWKLADGSCQRTFRGGHYNSINALLISDCGQLIYSSSGDATIKEWKLADGTCQSTLVGSPGSPIKPLVMSNDGQMLYSSSSNAVEEYKVIDGTCQRIFESYEDPIGTIALSEDGKFLYSSAKNGSIKEWVLTSGICQHTFREHQKLVRTIALSRDKKWLYSGSDNGLIEKWNLTNGICQRTFDSHQNSVTAITISENGQLLYFSGGKEIISEWNLVNDICQRTFTGQQQSIRTIALSQDGKLLYAGSHNGIEEWKLANGSSHYTTVDCPIFMSNPPIALSKDRRLFCHGGLNSFSTEGSAIEEWKLDGSCRNFKSNKDLVSAIAISDDSQLLYSGSEDGTIKEWDVATGECLRLIDTRLCAGANITNVKGLTPAQTDSLLALGAFSDD